ncbi:MAG: helix-turn-helix transcriptional regulator [Clostridia bacterium]|nr:helix-turn-helix transcriptional regulator [Clostridia bacterium]
MGKMYFEEFRRRVTDESPYAVFHRSDVSYVPHIHEEIEVGYVLYGTVRAGSEAGDFLLHEGDMFVFMPDEIHSLSTVTPNSVEILRILPKQSDKIDFGGLRLSSNRVCPADGGYAHLITPVLEMVREFDGEGEGREIALRKCRYEIFLALLRSIPHFPVTGEDRQEIASRTSLLRRVNDYISEHYADTISLDEIADYCGYSKYYFAHSIKEVTGTSFLDFLTMYRLSIACARLRDRDGSVTQIAFDCGFNNLRSFHRTFKKYYNVTPTEYRNEAESVKSKMQL